MTRGELDPVARGVACDEPRSHARRRARALRMGGRPLHDRRVLELGPRLVGAPRGVRPARRPGGVRRGAHRRRSSRHDGGRPAVGASVPPSRCSRCSLAADALERSARSPSPVERAVASIPASHRAAAGATAGERDIRERADRRRRTRAARGGHRARAAPDDEPAGCAERAEWRADRSDVRGGPCGRCRRRGACRDPPRRRSRVLRRLRPERGCRGRRARRQLLARGARPLDRAHARVHRLPQADDRPGALVLPCRRHRPDARVRPGGGRRRREVRLRRHPVRLGRGVDVPAVGRRGAPGEGAAVHGRGPRCAPTRPCASAW